MSRVLISWNCMHLLNCNGILRKSDGTIPAKAAAYRVSVRRHRSRVSNYISQEVTIIEAQALPNPRCPPSVN